MLSYLILGKNLQAELVSERLYLPLCLFISPLPSLSLSSPIIFSLLLSLSLLLVHLTKQVVADLPTKAI